MIHAWIGDYYSHREYLYDYSSSPDFDHLTPKKDMNNTKDGKKITPLPSNGELYLGVRFDYFSRGEIPVLDQYYSYEKFEIKDQRK